MTKSIGAVVVILCVSACGSPSAPLPDPPDGSITDPPGGPIATDHLISGTVSDENGPFVGAPIVVDYGPNLPDLNAGTRRITTASGAGGRYEVRIPVDPSQPRNVPLAMIRAGSPVLFSFGYTQLVEGQGTSTVRNIRLPRVQPINAGGSVTITVDSASSLCAVGGPAALKVNALCEQVLVNYPTDGTLTVEAHADSATVIPTVRTWNESGQGILSVPVSIEDFRTVAIAVEVPIGSAAQRYLITTSLRP